MKARLTGLCLVLVTCLAARAEQVPPRDIWPQATGAAASGDFTVAAEKLNELVQTGRSYGIKKYPLYASSAASMAIQASGEKNAELAAWAEKTAHQLDPSSPAVVFKDADRAKNEKRWGAAIPTVFKGYAKVFGNYRTSLLSRADLIVVASLALALTAVIFALALFIRYGRSMAHDFREGLGTRLRGGAVTVLAFALLFLPIFIWLGPTWLVFYWLIIFFGYAGMAERIAIVVLALLLALVPIALDKSAAWVAGVDSPVVMAAIASGEQSYQPEALRRMSELVAIVPDNATLHLLLGNLRLQEGDDQQAAVHYRRAAELKDSAGAHVNLGNLHYLDNDFAAASTEYQRAEQLDSKLAIAFYNDAVASGDAYRFDDQTQKLAEARKLDQKLIERLSANPPAQKVVIYSPPLAEAWAVAESIARRGAARSLFGNYVIFNPITSALNPITIGSLLVVLAAPLLWLRRRKAGYAGACIKCGRTFCYRCKSSRESATYCTQCIHIYLKRDGVSLDTKRTKLEQVSEHHTGMLRRNRFFATLLPGSAQLLEGRTVAGVLGLFFFLVFAAVAFFSGRLAPALGPVAELAQLVVRTAGIALALVMWFLMSLPVYRRKAA